MYLSYPIKLLLLLVLLLELTGCGYKPSAKYSREVLGKKISTSIIISQEDPQNSVIVKDSVDKAIVEIFQSSLVNRKYSDTHLSFEITNPKYTPVAYDNNGFVISYRATINLLITRETDDLVKKYKTSGTYDFSVVPNSVLTDNERFNAIRYSALKAIASFVAKVSAEGSRIK